MLWIIISGVSLFFFLLLLIDKNKNNQTNPVPNKVKAVRPLSLDQKIKLEKAATIQQVTATIKRIEEQKINQLIRVLNSVKEMKSKH